MIYKAVIRWTWHRIGHSKEKFENVYDAIKRYKELKKNKHSYDLIVGGMKIGLCHFANDVRIKIEQVKVRISHSPDRGIIKTGGISPWQTILTSNSSWMQSSTTRNMRSLG
jgi:hypothetical protein